MLRTSRPDYGFEYDEAGAAYVVNGEEMRIVRRIFVHVSAGETLNSVKRTLELECVPPPMNGHRGGKYWAPSFLRNLILDDVYRPHTFSEIGAMVGPEVAARLDESESYGVFWYNRTRTTRKKVSIPGPGGREYKTRHYVRKNPREQWVAVPVPDAGVPREVVDTAREMIKNNKAPSNAGRRFWQLPGGAVRCGACGTRMTQYAVPRNGRTYAYYKCARLLRFGKDGCSPARVRTNYRAEEVEQIVWRFVSELMRDPEQLREDLDRMIEVQSCSAHGDPKREAKAWLDKLAELDSERRGYLKLAARGTITAVQFDEALAELWESRSTAGRELATLQHRQVAIEALERATRTLCWSTTLPLRRRPSTASLQRSATVFIRCCCSPSSFGQTRSWRSEGSSGRD
jgi:hypothetical protein